MSTNRFPIFSITLLVIGAGWIWFSRIPTSGTFTVRLSVPRPGYTPPNFTLQTIGGAHLTLSDYRGQVILLNLWASWCPPCRAEMPTLEKIYQQYQQQGFMVLGLNATYQDDFPAVLDFVKDQGLSFPILLDRDGEVSRLYELRSLPTSFLIDRNGEISEVIYGGPIAEAHLRILVEQLLEEK